MRLPPADWTKRQGLSALIAALDDKVRYVGGAVRDTLLDLEVKDVDIATPLLPDDVIERLKAASIKVIPTGIAHGTVTAILPDGPVEITTLRRDVSTDGRRATVAFSEDWKEDAARRDFTINALSADPHSREIYDYFGGLDDLEGPHIRFIGSAAERIAEDHLRIMRYFRFLARFGRRQVDDEAFDACTTAAEKLETLSRERVADELLKLLQTEDPRFAVNQMLDAGIFDHIIREIDGDAGAQISRLVEREQRLAVAPTAIRRLVAILPKDVHKADAIAKDLKLSKKQQKAIGQRLSSGFTLAADNQANSRSIAYRTSVDAARDTALLFAGESALLDMLSQLKDWQPPTFPLTGGDLIKRGLKPGPVVAKTLATIETAWIAQGFPDETWIKKFVDEQEFPLHS
ncbi:MAG: CCA tRNA nucleotidyltransferase [Parasphingorhabdus sp.]|uniref:CCA tRNA nucleotidyltransferase n=1 Tax=Parasphingorhabdus sp. TaxID=2709688 RepID=UPI0032649ABF